MPFDDLQTSSEECLSEEGKLMAAHVPHVEKKENVCRS